MTNTKTKFFITILGTILVFSTFLVNISSAKAAYSAGTIISLTNSARSRNGLGSLSANSALNSAASAKAHDMFSNQYFAHTSPQGKTPWDFIRGAGYDYTFAGENLAIGYSDASELFNAWMASQTHRENILNSNFREIGVAVISGTYEGSETIIVVQEFGARESSGTGGEVAADQSTSTPAPQSSTVSQTPTPQNTTVQKTFSLIKDKSSFSPSTIYSGENVHFNATITGEVKDLKAKIFDQEYDLLQTASVSSLEDKKTYSVDIKIEKEGTSDVVISAKDKNGYSDSVVLGKLVVNKVTLVNEAKNQEDDSLFAGFKTSLQEFWYLYLIGLGAVLGFITFLILRRYKSGKNLKIRFAFWQF